MLSNNAARTKGCTPRLDLVNGAYYYTHGSRENRNGSDCRAITAKPWRSGRISKAGRGKITGWYPAWLTGLFRLSLLSRIYSVAINEWGWLHISPCREVHRNRETRRERYITDLELNALNSAASDRMSCIIDLAYLTAARKGDLLKIMLKDIRADGLHVRQQKRGKYQIFNWSPTLHAVVARAKKLRRKHDALYLFCTALVHTTQAADSIPCGAA
jgi:integrase